MRIVLVLCTMFAGDRNTRKRGQWMTPIMSHVVTDDRGPFNRAEVLPLFIILM